MIENITKVFDDSNDSDYGKNFKSELSSTEKVGIMENTFKDKKDIKNVVKYPANFLAGKFNNIDGFDARWSSLITNNPLLFEDIDYLRVKQFIDARITEEEIEAYKSGNLREMYATLENMLICNLNYYDRIMSFATMIFLHYVKINEFNYTDKLKNIPVELEMTPTRLWCCVLSGINSTEWELNYAWAPREVVKGKDGKIIIRIKQITIKPIDGSIKSIFEVSYNKLYKVPTFARFMEYSAIRCNTSGYRETLLHDNTPNEKLAQVCAKFTNASAALGENQLKTIVEYIDEIDAVNKRLYYALKSCLMKAFNNDMKQFAIWVFNSEYYIYTNKFQMKVYKDSGGMIKKDYLANSYECFSAEKYLFESIKEQIEWAKYNIPVKYQFDMKVLSSLLADMLKQNYKNVTCIKRMEDGCVSQIHFNGCYGNVRMFEELRHDSVVRKVNEKIYSMKNMSNFLVERGYYLIGMDDDIYRNFPTSEISQKHIINHYTKYCVPVIQEMSNVIFTHHNSKNEIINIVVEGDINPLKLNNKNILYTDVKEIDTKELMSISLKNQQNRQSLKKKTLLQVAYGTD